MIRATSARACERVKIWRGASRISGVILSSLMRLVALEDDAVDDRILADLDDEVAGVGAGDDDVGEQFGRVEVPQRLVEPLLVVGLADAQRGVGEHRLGLEPLVAGDRERRDGAGRLRRRTAAARRAAAPERLAPAARRRRAVCAAAGAARPPMIVPSSSAEHNVRPFGNTSFAVTRSRLRLNGRVQRPASLPVARPPCPIMASRSSGQARQTGQKRPSR